MLAQGVVNSIDTNVIGPLQTIVNNIIPIVVGLLVIAFFWGMAKYVFAQGDEAAKVSGKKIMIYGAIAMFVAFSIWGIIEALQTTLNIDAGITPGNEIVPVF